MINKSLRSSRFADEIIFSKNKDTSLLGVYIVAVQGFEYASYSIRATVKREEGEDVSVPIQLTEGQSHFEFIHGKNDHKIFQFKTMMYGNFVSDIRISLTKGLGDFKFYLRNGKVPTTTEYDYKSVDGSDIIMRKTDEKFEPVGIKYILVVPNTKYGTHPKRSRFSIKWSTATSIYMINNDYPVHGTVQVGQYIYFKYHSVTQVKELTVSLTPISGESNLVISTDHTNEIPTIDKNNYHSKKEGKDSIVIDGSTLFENNPNCNPSHATMVGGNPCEIYIGVYCGDSSHTIGAISNDSCSFSLKVYEEFGLQHLLFDGTPQKDHVKQGQLMTYFMPIETEKDYLYIAGNAEVGDINIYASFVDQSEKSDDLLNPTKDEHIKKSKAISHSQLIHFSKKEVRKNCEEFDECMVLISVEGDGAVQYNEYTLIAYTRIPKIIPKAPSVAVVEEGSMAYFTYKSYCDDCTIFISASAYSIDADIDMYLNIGGDKDLPTKDQHDIRLNEWFSEHIELSLDHPYMEDHKIKSMQETIIIGVYAKETTTISVEVEESKSKLKRLYHGKGVFIEQNENMQKFFEYEHKGDHDIKFEITGIRGEVDMRVNCYTPHGEDSPKNAFIPIDQKTSKWETNSLQRCNIIIESEDNLYCENGVYLVSVTSKAKGAKYTLEVQRGDTFTTKQIKIGVPIKDQIKEAHEKQYMFVLDKQKPFRVSASVLIGDIEYSIGTTKDYRKPIESSDEGDLIIDEDDAQKFEAGENVYIRVKGRFEVSEFILIVTHDDSYSIIPDSYPQEYTMDPSDNRGIHLMYYPPSTQHELKIQINGYSDGVGFILYTRKEYIYQIKRDRLEFPENNEHDIKKGAHIWERDNRHSVLIVDMESDRIDEYVILLTIKPQIFDPELMENEDKVKLVVNVNSHPMNILTPNIAYEENISNQLSDFSFFKFFAKGNKDLDVILIPCVCMTEMYIFKKHDDALSHQNVISRSSQMVNGQLKIPLRNAHGPYFIKVALSPDNAHTEFRDSSHYCAFQVVLVDKYHTNYKYSIDQYVPQNNGLIEYDWPQHDNLHLNWGKILKETSMGSSVHETYSSLYALDVSHSLNFINSLFICCKPTYL